MKTLKGIFFIIVTILGLAITENINAQTNDGISFQNKDSGLEKRIFMSGEDLSSTINLPNAKGKDVRTYVFNPHGEMVKDTTVNYQSPINLDIDENIKGEYTVISNIKGDSEVLRYSAAVVDSEKEGKKFEFEDWEDSTKLTFSNYFTGFAKAAVDANNDGHLVSKEIVSYSKFSPGRMSKRFDKKDKKLVIFTSSKENHLNQPKIKITGKENKGIIKYTKKENYGVIDISKATGKNFIMFVNGSRGASGINQVK